MDWKHKHFHQQRTFAAERAAVMEAARRFVTGTLGWEVSETADGFTAQGSSFSHRAIANYHIQTVAGGTSVTIELLVERAGYAGFMLFDVGGYYSIQIRHWLNGIQWELHQESTGTRDESQNPIVVANKKPAARVFNGCLLFIVVMFGLWFLVTLICAVIGLITGTLYLWGRGGTLVLHGTLARIISVIILLVAVFIAWRLRKKDATKRKPKILGQ